MMTLRIGFLSLGLCSAAIAEVNPTARFVVVPTTDDDSVFTRNLIIKLTTLDSLGEVPRNMNAAKSAAADPKNWTLEYQDEETSQLVTFQFAEVQQEPRSGDPASVFRATVPNLSRAKPTADGRWTLKISGADGRPALFIIDEETETPRPDDHEETLELIVKDSELALSDFDSPVERNFRVFSGGDGSLLGFDFNWDNGYRINENHEILGSHVQFEGSFSPDPEESLFLFGRFSGDAGVLKGVSLPTIRNVMNGNLLFDLNGRFEADQRADNYNGTVGIGAWAFVSITPLEQLGDGLRSILNPVGESIDKASNLTLFAGYDHVVDSKREPGIAEQGENRIRFRVRYRLPLRDSLDLPFFTTAFQVDGVIDASGIYDFHMEKLLAEWAPKLEFSPINQNQANMAFVLSYHQGKISPTFVDEEAFLAGLRFRF